MKVAVIGAGISGIGAAWLLSKQHEVHLFEAASRLGGHAQTVTIHEAGDHAIPMDTGFLVYNELTYPNLTSFFKILGVETVSSEMSLSVQVEAKKLEWSGANLNSVFSQRKNLLRPSFYKMLYEILRFGREADENLSLGRRHGWSLGELLRHRRHSPAFYTDYLLPIGAAIWSTPEAKMLDFPAETFIAFFINHKLLQINNRPIWRTVKDGSIQYVQKASTQIGRIHLSTPVMEVERRNGKVIIRTASESVEFDRVVMATHAPVTAALLKNQTPQEKWILSTIQYQSNRALLHTDVRVMPRSKVCWSSWNVLGSNNLQARHQVSLNYYLNRLQPLATQTNYFVALNPTQAPSGILKEFDYAHPQFDRAALRAQQELPAIQGNGGVYYAGAWSRYGFHEDGLLSAVRVAALFGVTPPWSPK